MATGSFPTKGPVLIENMTKREIVIQFITGKVEVTQEHRAHSHNTTRDQVVLGSALDRDAAKQFERQKRDNEAEMKRDPGVPPIDPRLTVHNPELRIEDKEWQMIKSTPSTWKFLNGLARKRDIRVQAA